MKPAALPGSLPRPKPSKPLSPFSAGLKIEPTPGPTNKRQPLQELLRQASELVSQGQTASSPTQAEAPVAPTPILQDPITPQNPIGIGPVKAEWADWRRRADTHARTMFAYQEGDTLDDITWKMRGRTDFTRKLEALDGSISPDDVDAIAQEVYSSVAPKSDPFGGFSKEAQTALTEAYTSQVGGRPTVTAKDIDPNQAAAMGAWLVTGLLRGMNPTQALDGVSRLVGSTQQRLDANHQAATEQDQLRREAALQKFRAITARDVRAEEVRAAESRDRRTSERQSLLAGEVSARQESADERRARREAYNFVLRTISEGDPNRVPVVVRAYESEYGPLPEGIGQVEATMRQQLDFARTRESEAKVDQILASTQNLKSDALFKEKSMQDRLRKVALDADLGERRLRELDLVLDFVPKEQKAKLALWWSQVHENEAAIDARAKQAEAALIRAKRAGDSKAIDLEKQLQQRRIGYQGLLDQATRQYVNLQGSADRARAALTKALATSDANSPEAMELRKRISDAESGMQELDRQIEANRSQVESVLKQIDQIAAGPMAPNPGYRGPQVGGGN